MSTPILLTKVSGRDPRGHRARPACTDGRSLVLGLVVTLVASLASPAFAAEEGDPGFTSLFDVYQANRRDGVPSFVTADLLLASYSLARQRLLLTQEAAMAQRLARLVEGLNRAVADEPEDAPGQANRDLVAILTALLRGNDRLGVAEAPNQAAKARIDTGTEGDGRAETPAAAATDVGQPAAKAADPTRAQAELDLILQANGITRSPLWGWPLDYSQFRPRGPYAADPHLAAYFRAMRYAALVLFPALESQATGVSTEAADRAAIQALRLARHIQADAALRGEYDAIDGLYRWQFGAGEDLTLDDLLAAPADAGPADTRAWLFERAKREGRQPRILAGIVDDTALESGRTPADVLTGFRLLPARYSADTAALQRLVYDQVGAYQGDVAATPVPFGLGIINGQPVKAYPSVNELLALLGSRHAGAAIQASGETSFEGYPEAAAEAADRLAQAEGLLALQLRLMRAGLGQDQGEGEGGTGAVHDTQMKAFWTWQRYLAILHGKPSYTVGSKGFIQPAPRSAAWLEPAVALYRALAEIVAAHREQAQDQAARETWDDLAEVLAETVRIAEQELGGTALAPDDLDWLNALDQHLSAIAGAKDRPIVVDIHSSPATGKIVVEGTGVPAVVTHPLADGNQARGARFTHHERKWPLEQRPTNADWRDWLERQSAATAAPEPVPAHAAPVPAEAGVAAPAAAGQVRHEVGQ